MQLAVYPGVAGKSIGAPQASIADGRTKNKFLIGSIAVLGASVVMANPVASSPVLADIQHRAVQLVSEVTDSPATVYQDLFTQTFANVNALAAAYQANPLPVLSQIIANQIGYTNQLSTAVNSTASTFQSWWDNGTPGSKEPGAATPGKTLLANSLAGFQSGDSSAAYESLNEFMLYGMQKSVLPVLKVLLSIPPQQAQNFANAVAAISSTSTLVSGAFQAIYAPVSGTLFEASRASVAISTAIQSGDIQGALTAIVNTPGVLLNAALNGFDYNNDPTTQSSWAGLLSVKSSTTSTGTLQQFLLTIPTKIATAIDNDPTTPANIFTSLQAAIAASTASSSVTSLAGTTTATSTSDAAAAASTAQVQSLSAAPATDSTSTDTAATASAAGTTAAAAVATKVAATTTTDSTSTGSTSTDTKKSGDRVTSAVKKLTDKLKTTKSDSATASDSASSSTSKSGKKDSAKTKRSAKKESKGSNS
ncbi:hypothetical protein [Mycobacterium sp. OTB74]|uniref:hypothetical protein n=1 Tax=Mycobacterium sp. OTB74 TaxID=1853452 RepID=UPI002473CD2E|nr:hypothetical protein [Mycobacterium sp. OTB74]MDH6243716.1 hypothetical protein [Mycobacterium sp. OTB74]